METLEDLLKAYEARLKSTKFIEQRWQRYPKPNGESRQLELFKLLVETTHDLVEKVSQSPHKKREVIEVKERITKEK